MCDTEGHGCFNKAFFNNGVHWMTSSIDKCQFCTNYTECDKTQYEYSVTSTSIDETGQWCSKLNPIRNQNWKSKAKYLTGNPLNPPMLGITAHSLSPGQVHDNGYYNEFVSNILLNPVNLSLSDKIERKCKEVLERVAFVEIEMTNHDAIMVEITSERVLTDTLSSLGNKVTYNSL